MSNKSDKHTLECLRLEADCRELAKNVSDPELQLHYLQMADHWAALAVSEQVSPSSESTGHLAPGYVSELVCGICANTGHVTWERTSENHRPLHASSHIQLHPEKPDIFTCLKCGTQQELG